MLRRMGLVSAHGLLWVVALGVCAAQMPPPTDSTNAAASVVTLTGQVSVLRDSNPWALQVGDRVQPRQVIITGPDGHALFKISDGSTFEVFPNSRVIFRNTPGDWKDLLEMLLGRIKVHIQKWNGQDNYNRVRTPTAIISVRGTVFDVAVEDSDATLVVVEEGQVTVQHALLPRGNPKVLNPGDRIVVWKDQPLTQRSIDRTNVIQGALRAAADAIYTAIYRTPRSSGPAAGGPSTGGSPGDSKRNPPPSSGPAPGDAGPGAPSAPPPPPPGP